MRRLLVSAIVVTALLSASHAASALTISHFQVYDAGNHITFKWRVCTSVQVRAQTILSLARVGKRRHWNRHYYTITYDRGCNPWNWTLHDRYANGTWAAYVQVGLNPVLDRSPVYRFPIQP